MRPRLLFLAIAGMILAAAAFFGWTSDFGGRMRPLSGLNGWLYDGAVATLVLLRGPEAWSRTAVILIDQPTLAAFPWSAAPRALQQPQLAALGADIFTLGASKIGFDLVLAFDPARLRLPFAPLAGYDAAFAGLLKARAGSIVLGADSTILPAQTYLTRLGPGDLGAIDVQTEDDGIVRSVATRLRLAGGRPALSFATALARAGAARLPSASRSFLLPQAPLDQIPHLSALLFAACFATTEGHAKLAAWLRGRVVVIGAGIAGEDSHRGPDRFLPSGGWGTSKPQEPDPCAGQAEIVPGRMPGQMPGAFLQAAAAESLMRPHPLALAGPEARIGVNVAIAVLALLAHRLVARTGRLAERRGWLFGTSLGTGLALLVAILAFGLAALLFEACSIGILRLWVPIGPTLSLVALVGIASTMILALRRDLALADLRIAFGRWLPRPVIEATLGPSRLPLHGEARTITVLIADLKNFTTFCAAHRSEPESIVTALNHKFSAAQRVIDRYGGCLDKFDGDAVIAFWNGIEPQADHARRAIAAAAAIIAADQAGPSSDLRFKAAVATGLAFVGRYGSEQKSNFSAIGEPMNLAARLETLCTPHGLDIVIAEASVRAAGEVVRKGEVPLGESGFVRVGEASLKGFAAPVAFYTLDVRAFSA